MAIALHRMAAQALGERNRRAGACFTGGSRVAWAARGAVTATAHQARLAWNLWYVSEHGGNTSSEAWSPYQQKMREQLERSLQRKATELGL